MSDLLIKGIGMPRPGKPIMLMVTSEGNVFANMVGELSFTEIKAFELPPHGRLGDLDALFKLTEKRRYQNPHWDELSRRHHDSEHLSFLNMISNAPTIIPESE